MTTYAKELAILADVTSKVDALSQEIASLEQRLSQHTAALSLVLWRHNKKTQRSAISIESNTELRKRQYALKMSAWGADHNLMKNLFTLDTVLGDDEVKSKRKAQVMRIKALIVTVERLTARVGRLDAWAQRILPALPPSTEQPSSATAPAPAPSPTPTSTSPASSTSSVAPMSDDSGSAASKQTDATLPFASASASASASPPALVPALSNKKESTNAKEQDSAKESEKSKKEHENSTEESESSGFMVPPHIKRKWPQLELQCADSVLCCCVLCVAVEERDLGNSLRLRCDLRRVRPSEVSVKVSKHKSVHVLTVRGLRRPQPHTQSSWFMGDDEEEDSALPYGWFEEHFTLPSSLDGARTTHAFTRDGQLTIVVPRALPTSPTTSAPAKPKAKAAPSPLSHAPQYHAYQRPQSSGFGFPFFGGSRSGLVDWF